ncbi:MAG TPA: hypothetical protein VE999_19145 [Gemmataceae bacterium]|nr:hypothetical protein [Gemmataceae bacterium]
MPVICEGCGQRVPIPDGYRRNKIQCACGVICPVPESAREEAAAPAAKQQPAALDEAERWLLEDAPSTPPSDRDPLPAPRIPPSVPADSGERTAKSSSRKPAVAEMRFPCRRCRRMVRRQGECPDCDGFSPSEAEQEGKEPVWWPSVDEPKGKEDDEEDSSPYGVTGADDVKCPKCSFMLPPGSVLCVRCGFHLKKRKKVTRTYTPIERVWETNGSYRTRQAIFWICEAVFGAVGVLGVIQGEAKFGMFLVTFLGLTAMLAFLLGTFDRIHLTRDTRGRVQLIKTWRVCFFAQSPRSVDVFGFEGIQSGRHRPVSPWDAWIMYFLIVFGLIPGLIWWYLVFYQITYHVSLTRDHGCPAYIVYSGWSEKKMKEIAYMLREASGLPYEEG